MATQNELHCRTLEAAADLSANQYYFVKVDATGKAALCAAVTDIPIGVLQNKPTAGQAATVAYAGTSKILAGVALAPADLIGTDAAGKAAPYVAGTDTTAYVAGTALATASAAGEIISALISTAACHRAS
jgi:hypothetical protein